MPKTIDIAPPRQSNRITIGIPCFSSAPAETLDDYMRFAYYLGRFYPEWDFFLAIKDKFEQFRARNTIVNAALQVDSKYLLMLDDDHVIDWSGQNIARLKAAQSYDFLRKLINHMEVDPQLGLVGALYYHRGGDCRPVIMKEGEDHCFYWIRDDEIIGGLQEVAVTGGGCMLLRCDAILKMIEPYFEPEYQYGTDVQICKKMRELGYKVACDTSIELGHVKSTREIITSQNRHREWADYKRRGGGNFSLEDNGGVNLEIVRNQTGALYRGDVAEYCGIKESEIIQIANQYEARHFQEFDKYEDKREYYKNIGKDHVVRNCLYQFTPHKSEVNQIVFDLINTTRPGYGLDFGCATGFASFELCQRGHHVDFVDINGNESYEFLKWRIKKRGLSERAGFNLKGPYDYILLLDVIEHLQDWPIELLKLTALLKENGAIITNYWLNNDFDNVEHISMDKDAVQAFLIERSIYPVNNLMWLKYDLSKVGKRKPDDGGPSHAA